MELLVELIIADANGDADANANRDGNANADLVYGSGGSSGETSWRGSELISLITKEAFPTYNW